MKVYLIAGKAGSGKNYVASILKEKLSSSIITSLSKYIKLFAIEMGLWDGNDNNKPREFLQNTGDLMRAIDPNFLTKRLLEDIKVYEKLNISNIIVSDVRLINEIEYLTKNIDNTITIRVNSKDNKRNLTDKEKQHITEIELDNYSNFDYIIDNNQELDKEIDKIIGGK